jgi:hypothetical protein
MRILKWAALIVIIVAVIATVVHLRRDAIATGIANSILHEQGFEVIDLSVDKVAPDRLELAELIIETAAGARYTVSGLSMPVSLSGAQAKQISAERLIVTYGEAQPEREMLGTALQAALEFPLTRPGLDVTIVQVSLPNLPELSDVIWDTMATSQELSFTIDGILVDVGVVRGDPEGHAITISATRGGAEQVLSADIGLTRRGEKYRGSGAATIQTSAWLPIFRALDLIPAGLESLDATLAGPIELLFDESGPGNVAFVSRLGLRGELAATYRSTDGSLARVDVAAVDELAITFDYPSLEWTAQADTVDTSLTAAGFNRLPTLLNDLECRAGTRCTMQAAVDARDVQWNGFDFGMVELFLPIAVELDEITRIVVSSAASAAFGSVRTPALAAEEVRVVAFSGTEVVVEAGAWRCLIDELQLNVKGFTDGDKLTASFPVTFGNFDVRDSAAAFEAQVSIPPGADAAWDGTALLLPGAEGTASILDEQLTASLRLRDGKDALSADLDVAIDLTSDTGSFSVSDALVAFDRANLSTLVPGWPHPLDIVHGSWSFGLDLNWRADDATTRYSGAVTSNLDSLAGKYNDIGFAGLNTSISANLDPAEGTDVAPISLAVDLVDIGLPLERIAAKLAIDPDNAVVQVDELSAEFLGGALVADAFRYHLTTEQNAILLHAKSVQLQLMVDLLGSEGIKMTGAVSGELPVTMSGDNITIEAGWLQSDPPGGVIRYQGDAGVLNAAVPDDGLGLVTRALSNFEFDDLTSDVDYTEAGDLKLQMRFTGISPDVDDTQPIVLNLGVENNVPQLLRSLQAIRSIEDILERQTANQAPRKP